MADNRWNTLYGKYNETTMVDAYTDTVFFSDLLPKKCPTLYQSLDTILTNNSIDHRLLTNTRDIWCRDYMPIQTGEKRFVFYKYNPDYLQTKYYQRTITDVKGIGSIDSLCLGDAVDLDLVVDGGNVVRCGNKIVMTEKVFFENKDKAHKEVQRLLEEAFQCDIVFLPWDRNEIMGHSDGIIHYLGDNRVMMTNYADFDIAMARKFTRLLGKHFEVVPLSYNTKRKHKHSWAYINFLQVGRMVLVPQLGIPEDEQALQQVSEAMPSCKVIGVPAIEAVCNGGALNCIFVERGSAPVIPCNSELRRCAGLKTVSLSPATYSRLSSKPKRKPPTRRFSILSSFVLSLFPVRYSVASLFKCGSQVQEE